MNEPENGSQGALRGPVTQRSEDPAWAAKEAFSILTGPTPPQGDRQEWLVDLAHRCAEAGYTNDEMVTALEVAAVSWGKFPRIWDRWTRILSLVAMARRVYPNSPDGSGWRP